MSGVKRRRLCLFLDSSEVVNTHTLSHAHTRSRVLHFVQVSEHISSPTVAGCLHPGDIADLCVCVCVCARIEEFEEEEEGGVIDCV